MPPVVFPSNLHLICVVVVVVAVVFVFGIVVGGVFIFHEKAHLLKFNISVKTALLIAPKCFPQKILRSETEDYTEVDYSSVVWKVGILRLKLL